MVHTILTLGEYPTLNGVHAHAHESMRTKRMRSSIVGVVVVAVVAVVVAVVAVGVVVAVVVFGGGVVSVVGGIARRMLICPL